MKKHIKSGIILIFLIIFFFIFYSNFIHEKQPDNLNSVFNNIGISIKGFENFNLIENKNNRIVAHYDEAILTVLSIENIKKELARKFVNDKIAVLEAQYDIRDAPYPGDITRNVVCPEQFKPIKDAIKNEHSLVNYLLYSTKSLAYGVCVRDLVSYKSFLSFFYCDNKGLFQIEFFVPINDEKHEEKFNNTLEKISLLDF